MFQLNDWGDICMFTKNIRRMLVGTRPLHFQYWVPVEMASFMLLGPCGRNSLTRVNNWSPCLIPLPQLLHTGNRKHLIF
jgi:hypothetical protein